jgi:hypothetical protein
MTPPPTTTPHGTTNANTYDPDAAADAVPDVVVGL